MAEANAKAKPAVKSTRAGKIEAAVQELETTLLQTAIVMVSFSALEKSPLNVRTIPYPADSVAELADSIAALGLLHNLVVHTLPEGKYGVAAGGRRLAAMTLLAERGDYAVSDTVPVKIVPDALAVAASMTENGQRRDMHPAEQIAGFRTLAAEGKSPAQTGDLLGYSSRHVRRCLKLAGLAPALLNELAQDTLTLEQCQALALEDDPARQVQVWEAAKQYYGGNHASASYLRSQIVSGEILTGSAPFIFVGEAAYAAAGGVIRRDLFSDDDSAFADRLLTEKLVLEKLEAEAQRLQKEEGWAWCGSRMGALKHYGEDHKTWLLNMPEPEFSADEEEQIRELDAAIEGCTTCDDENELQQKLEDIESAALARALTPEFKAQHGVFVSFEFGDFVVQRGVLRFEEKTKNTSGDAQCPDTEAAANKAGITRIAPPSEKADVFPATLVKAMSSERTLAVQAALAGNAQVSVALLKWTLCHAIFNMSYCKAPNPLKFSLINSQYTLKNNSLSGENGTALVAMQTQASEIAKTLPEGWEYSFTWLLDWPQEYVLKLLGFCVAFGIDGVQERLYNRTVPSPLEALEAALDFDLRDWWQPTAEGYFCRLSKGQIGDALADAGFSVRARDVAKMKKSDAAEAAADTVSATRWVPDWMTRPQPESKTDAAITESTVTEITPDQAA